MKTTSPLWLHRYGKCFVVSALLFVLPLQATLFGIEDETQGHAVEKQHTNRLAKETSPYLLMHAHNPVNWYPWGPEALGKAVKENKLIFLSVGYSSCHWCHVMERESFLDPEIAALMNKHFVCIKVDSEERPDVDSIYMTSLHVYHQMTGSDAGGGWPLSMFLTPDGKPFFGGTYSPARDGDRGGATGFLTILSRVHQFWQKQPDGVRQNGAAIAQATKAALEGQQTDPLAKIDSKLLDEALATLSREYDDEHGGFGFSKTNPRRPKFPEPSNLMFLIDRVQKANDERAKEMLIGTLDHMAMGGIRDHLGGGFHRYSVDRFWHIPHFEKMLYDNGQLASVYAEAFALTGRQRYRRVVDEMLEFVMAEMTAEGGGFFAAIDADSEGEEGKFYRWQKQQITSLLNPDEFASFASVYGLNDQPNFEQHYYAPQLKQPLKKSAEERQLSESELDAAMAPIRKKLFDVRGERPRPLTDNKILTSWNGLMIRGFADAGRCLDNDRYIQAGSGAAKFVLDKLQTKDGRLMRTYNVGQARLNAYVEDYAFLIDGLIALYRATDDEAWLAEAETLMEKQIELFWDETNGGFFFTSDDHETLLARAKSPSDGARPSGNSVSAANLVFLARRLGKPDYRKKARRTITSVGPLLSRSPSAATRMMVAVSELLGDSGDKGAK